MSTAQHLDDLERRSLIALAAATPDLAYIFRHVLAQDAVYASLVRRQRGAIHGLVGDVLENLYARPTASPQLAALLGRHFGEAGDGARALPYLVQAGDHALSQYANREAADYYDRAIEIAQAQPGAAGLAHLYEARGQALERSGAYAEALAGYEEMEAQAAGNEAQLLAALTAQTRLRSTFTTVSDPAQGRALAERALPLARRLGDGPAEVRLLLYTMRQFVWFRDTGQVIAYGERAAEQARAQGLHGLLLDVLNELVRWGYVNTMQLRLAGERMEEARALLPLLDDPYQRVETLGSLAMLQLITGDYDQAQASSAELGRNSQPLDYGWGLSQYHVSAGNVHLERGELGLAIQHLEDGVRLGNLFSVGQSAVITAGFLASAYRAVGETNRGLEAVQRVKELLMARNPSLAAWPLLAETLLHLGAGSVREGAAAFDQARKADPPKDIIAYRLLANAGAELALAEGEYDRVLDVTGPVIDDMRREGGRTFLCEALAYRGRALLAAGRLDEAGLTLAEARALAEATGQRLVLWTILAAQLELSVRQGQTAEADPLRDKLRTLLHQLADAAGSPERRAGFLATPNVQAALQL